MAGYFALQTYGIVLPDERFKLHMRVVDDDRLVLEEIQRLIPT